MNYDLLRHQVDHWKRITGDHRLFICDNTPAPSRHKFNLPNFYTLDDLGPPGPARDGNSHGLALDYIIRQTDSDIVGIVDSDFFWTKLDILGDVIKMFEQGYKCVGTELWYDCVLKVTNKLHPQRAGWLAPCVFGMFIDRNLALSETFVVTSIEGARDKCETGWKMRRKIIEEKIPCHVYRGFRYPDRNREGITDPYLKSAVYDACYFGTEAEPMGVHLLKGSAAHSSFTRAIPHLIEKGISHWRQKP